MQQQSVEGDGSRMLLSEEAATRPLLVAANALGLHLCPEHSRFGIASVEREEESDEMRWIEINEICKDGKKTFISIDRICLQGGWKKLIIVTINRVNN